MYFSFVQVETHQSVSVVSSLRYPPPPIPKQRDFATFCSHDFLFSGFARHQVLVTFSFEILRDN